MGVSLPDNLDIERRILAKNPASAYYCRSPCTAATATTAVTGGYHQA